MVLEIGAGWWFNSMSLLADGWHMGTHAAAIGMTTLAYAATRRLKHDASFAFGPWKLEILAAFASAVTLLAVAVAMVVASIERLVDPRPIAYVEAIAVALLGLAVNGVCAWLLGAQGHDHAGHHGQHDGHGHGHAHAHQDQTRGLHTDLNLRAAYVHVLADAATSALAIGALAGGLWFGWAWLDPLIGVVGAVMVARWGVGLVRDSSRVLLDREMDV